MLSESLIILALLVFLAGGYFATKRKYTIAIIPLTVVPLFNVLACLFSAKLAQLLGMREIIVYTSIVVLSLILTAVFLSYVSMRFVHKKSRAVYVSISVVFEIVLACIFIYNEYIRLMP